MSRREHDEARRAHDARKAERHRIREMRRNLPYPMPMPQYAPQYAPQYQPQYPPPQYQPPQYQPPQYQPPQYPQPQPPSALKKGPGTKKRMHWGNVAEPHQKLGKGTLRRISDPLKFLKERQRKQDHDRRKYGSAINAPRVVFQDKGSHTTLGKIKEGRRKHGRLEFRIDEETKVKGSENNENDKPIDRGWFPLEKLMELGKGTPLETWCAHQENCKAESYPEY